MSEKHCQDSKKACWYFIFSLTLSSQLNLSVIPTVNSDAQIALGFVSQWEEEQLIAPS